MRPSQRIRLVSALVIVALGFGNGCKSTGDPELDAFLCEVFGVVFVPNAFLTLRDGETTELSAFVTRSRSCTGSGVFSAMGSNPLAMDFGGVTFAEFDPLLAPGGVLLPRNDQELLLQFKMPITLNLAGNFGLELGYSYPEANFSATSSLNVTSQPARGVINVQISGLPSGVPAEVYVGVDAPGERLFTTSGAGKFFAGLVEYEAFSVTGPDATVYAPTPAAGVVPLAIDETKTLSIAYSADAPAMGMVNLGVAGLPAGLNGSVTVTGNGVNQTFQGSSWVPLQAGVYTFTSNTVGNSVNDYNDPQPAREVMVTGGQTVDVLFTYAIIATLVQFNVLGLESGLSPLITLTRGLETRTVSANTAALKLAVGLWTVAMLQRTISGRTYVATGASATSLNVVAQTAAMSLALVYYCSTFQWQIAATLGILSDPHQHASFVNMLLTAHLLNLLWLFPDPAPAPVSAGQQRANQTAQQTVTISGQGAFVQVSGTRATNGALSLSGVGTVAGFPNVPVTLTGTLTNAGALTAVQYTMGQATPPTGLPNGPIIYSISTPAPPGFDFLGGILNAAARH